MVVITDKAGDWYNPSPWDIAFTDILVFKWDEMNKSDLFLSSDWTKKTAKMDKGEIEELITELLCEINHFMSKIIQ